MRVVRARKTLRKTQAARARSRRPFVFVLRWRWVGGGGVSAALPTCTFYSYFPGINEGNLVVNTERIPRTGRPVQRVYTHAHLYACRIPRCARARARERPLPSAGVGSLAAAANRYTGPDRTTTTTTTITHPVVKRNRCTSGCGCRKTQARIFLSLTLYFYFFFFITIPFGNTRLFLSLSLSRPAHRVCLAARAHDLYRPPRRRPVSDPKQFVCYTYIRVCARPLACTRVSAPPIIRCMCVRTRRRTYEPPCKSSPLLRPLSPTRRQWRRRRV